jgi:hypothetical protein
MTYNIGDTVSVYKQTGSNSLFKFETITEVRRTTVKVSNGKTYLISTGYEYGKDTRYMAGAYVERITPYRVEHKLHNERVAYRKAREGLLEYVKLNVARVQSETLELIVQQIKQELGE